MDANLEVATAEEAEVSDPAEDDDLRLQLGRMSAEEIVMDTEAGNIMSREVSVNTEEDWELQVEAMMEVNKDLKHRHDNLLKQLQQEKDEHVALVRQLQKKKEDGKRQHQALLGKLDLVRVKLQLNNSQTAKQTFLSKKEEMSNNKLQAEEERSRLNEELAAEDAKLVVLAKEQEDDQKRWLEELDELRQKMDQVKKEAKEAKQQALRDEIAALESQRDLIMSYVNAWLREVALYLSGLEKDFPQQFHQERPRWEKEEAAVRQKQANLESRFQDARQQLLQGRRPESLPKFNIMSLPEVPMDDLRFKLLMRTLHPPLTRATIVPQPPNHYLLQRQHLHRSPSPHQMQLQHRFHAPQHQGLQCVQGPAGATVSRPGLSPSPPFQPAYPVVPSPPPPSDLAAKLESLLEKLGSSFPNCTRDQLRSLLQKVKNDRGTMAGLTTDEVVELVGRQLETPLCLICLNQVEPEQRLKSSCNHIIHRDCIQVWQQSKIVPCPFCLTTATGK